MVSKCATIALLSDHADHCFATPVEPLFAALSHCASLHPSVQDDAGGNPFAGMGPFGTGNAISDAQQFDDADENGLSESGRVRADFQTPDARYRPY